MKTRAKSIKIINSIDCVDVRLQSVMTYTYICSRTQLFESNTVKFFLNKLNLKPYSNSMFWENRILRYLKPESLIFVTSASSLDFLYFGFLMLFSPFSCLKTSWVFKSSSKAHAIYMFRKLSKLDSPE
jgi:hypothetical protein